MKQTRLLMGMPITVEIISVGANRLINDIFDYFTYVDNKYSTYKPSSEISYVNKGLPKRNWSKEMAEVLALCDQTKQQTGGYFDISHDGQIDPSGLVKGWAISRAAELLKRRNVKNFYIDAGGDIQTSGLNRLGKTWSVGIRNPFNRQEIIKTVRLKNQAIATSGTAIRGQHIYNPHAPKKSLDEAVSLSVIANDIYDADRFATAAFAMGIAGVNFIETLPGLEAYMILKNRRAFKTSGFERHAVYAQAA